MSSDSDSDICDFTTDISKQMSKGLNQFWDNYKKKEVAKESETTTLEDDIDFTIPGTSTKGSKAITSTKDDSTNIPTSLSTKDKAVSKEAIEKVSVRGAEDDDINIPQRITNKLNELSAEIETLLEDKRRRGRKKRGRKSQTRAAAKKKKNASASAPNLPTCLTLSSDEEVTPVGSASSNGNTNKNNIEVNPIVTVQVVWKSVERNFFKVAKYQLLSCIPKYYCEKFKVNPKLLFFTLDDKQLNLEECSFVSLRLDEKKVIEGGVLPESFLTEEQVNTTPAVITEGELNFKVQYSDHRTNGIDVKCKKGDKMEIIFWQVAKYLKEPVDCVKLYFDGRLVLPENQISDLDLEEGDCFDLEIIKKTCK